MGKLIIHIQKSFLDSFLCDLPCSEFLLAQRGEEWVDGQNTPLKLTQSAIHFFFFFSSSSLYLFYFYIIYLFFRGYFGEFMLSND